MSFVFDGDETDGVIYGDRNVESTISSLYPMSCRVRERVESE